MVDGLQGLGHHPVVGGDNQNYKIGDFRAAGTHGSKRLMTGGIKKNNLAPICGNMVGADVLCNSTGFGFRYFGFADNIQQGGFTVVNMAHDGNHRRPFL